MRISAVLIGKNEQEMLGRCLESVKGLDNIYFTDTGSTDNTLEIAKKYTKNITHFKWIDNFAKARNFALAQAKETEWILSIDCDETLVSVDSVRHAVEEAEKRNALAVDCYCIAEDNGQVFKYPRLFKKDPRVWWEGAIHNTLSVIGEEIGKVEIMIGYSPAHKNDLDRAFRILKKEAEREESPRTLFYLGREYFYRGMYEDTVKTMGKYVQISRFLPEKAEAFLVMARSYWAMKMADDARDAIVQALIINPHFKEAVLFMADLAGRRSGNEKWEANAKQWMTMAETADNRDVLFVRKVE